MNKALISQVKASFESQFNGSPELIVRAPGRINILGEHTDYNDGFVLPGAIDKAIYIAISLVNDTISTVYSLDFDETVTFDTSSFQKSDVSWSNYILGVIDELQKTGMKVSNFIATFAGDIPVGSGLSSSAALECGFGFAFNTLNNGSLNRSEIAVIGQKAENNFVGMQCGIMDQFASVMGKEGHVFKLDCRSLEYSYHPLQLDGYEVVLFNSMVHHNLVDSEYNLRRQDCEAGIELLNDKGIEVTHLRDVTLKQLDQYKSELGERVYIRCAYVVNENDRVERIVEAMDKGDLPLIGELMFATHHGLSSNYEVSCEEMDYLVSLVEENEAVIGARMMGGGFGGCTINIIKKDQVDQIIEQVLSAYRSKYKKQAEVYHVHLSDGVGKVELNEALLL